MTYRRFEGIVIAARLCQYAATMAPPFRKETMTAIEKWKTSLVSSQRGPLVTQTAATREQAIAIARRLLDDVAPDLAWLHGEEITVEIEAAGQVFGKYGSKIRLGPLGNGVFGQAERSPDRVGGRVDRGRD